MSESISLKATARVKLTKCDEAGNVVEVEEHEVKLTKEEAEELWHLHQQV